MPEPLITDQYTRDDDGPQCLGTDGRPCSGPRNCEPCGLGSPAAAAPTQQDVIERALNSLIPDAAPASLRVDLIEAGPFGINSWSGDIPGLAELLAAALHDTDAKPAPAAPATRGSGIRWATPADGALLRWAAARLRTEKGQHGTRRYDYETGPGMGHAADRLDEWADEIHPATTTPSTTEGN